MIIGNVLEQLVPGLLDIYGNFIDRIVLYGSVARGTQTSESDVDVAIILRNGATKAMHDSMLDFVVDLELNCGKVLSVISLDAQRYEDWKDVLPFYRNIQKEGIVLWKAA